jgi:FKBP-type peptidyl-prolyl cis-trans isomerase 2
MRVLQVSAQAILVDLNHPLAGQAVRFEVEVCALRPASDEELDRARAEIDERLVDDGTIVYGTEPGEGETHASIPTGDQLTRLRVRTTGSDEEPR